MSPNEYARCGLCGAPTGMPCLTASGQRAKKPHAVREVAHPSAPALVADVKDFLDDNPTTAPDFADSGLAIFEPKDHTLLPLPGKGDGVYRGLHRGKPVNGRVVGITPVAKGQMVQSPRHAIRKRKQAERRARRLSARGNGGGKR